MRISRHFSLVITIFGACVALGVSAHAESKEKNPVVLKVNGEEVTKSDVSDAWNSLFPGGAAPDFDTFDESVRQNVLKGLVSEKLLYKEAEKSGVPEREDIQRRLKNLEKQLAIQAFVEEKSNALITEKSLKEAYQQYVAKAKNNEEVRARHILVDSEEKANALYERLKKGEDFSKLAKAESKDTGSGARGGDLDYFTKDKMVKEFADAAFTLKKGEISKPLKTEFGWHIIKLEDRRPQKLESFEEKKEELTAELRKKALQQYIDGLVAKADVIYYGPDGKPKPLNMK